MCSRKEKLLTFLKKYAEFKSIISSFIFFLSLAGWTVETWWPFGNPGGRPRWEPDATADWQVTWWHCHQKEPHGSYLCTTDKQRKAMAQVSSPSFLFFFDIFFFFLNKHPLYLPTHTCMWKSVYILILNRIVFNLSLIGIAWYAQYGFVIAQCWSQAWMVTFQCMHFGFMF